MREEDTEMRAGGEEERERGRQKVWWVVEAAKGMRGKGRARAKRREKQEREAQGESEGGGREGEGEGRGQASA